MTTTRTWASWSSTGLTITRRAHDARDEGDARDPRARAGARTRVSPAAVRWRASRCGDAAQNWQHRCSGTVREVGFTIEKVSPCHFFHRDWQVCGLERSNDFVLFGVMNYLGRIWRASLKANITLAGPERCRIAAGVDQEHRVGQR